MLRIWAPVLSISRVRPAPCKCLFPGPVSLRGCACDPPRKEERHSGFQTQPADKPLRVDCIPAPERKMGSEIRDADVSSAHSCCAEGAPVVVLSRSTFGCSMMTYLPLQRVGTQRRRPQEFASRVAVALPVGAGAGRRTSFRPGRSAEPGARQPPLLLPTRPRPSRKARKRRRKPAKTPCVCTLDRSSA